MNMIAASSLKIGMAIDCWVTSSGMVWSIKSPNSARRTMIVENVIFHRGITEPLWEIKFDKATKTHLFTKQSMFQPASNPPVFEHIELHKPVGTLSLHSVGGIVTINLSATSLSALHLRVSKLLKAAHQKKYSSFPIEQRELTMAVLQHTTTAHINIDGKESVQHLKDYQQMHMTHMLKQ